MMNACGKNFARPGENRRRGAVLIVAMVTCATLAGMVLVLSHSMASEAIAAANRAAQLQASTIELGAEQYVMGVITDQGTASLQLTDDQFDAIPVGDGYFWVLRPQYDDPSLPTFGLVDESSKLNINTCSAPSLLLLPGMNNQPDVAGSIYNWRNTNPNQMQSQGAQNDFYLSQSTPYYMKSNIFPPTTGTTVPYETVEELLLVDGVDKTLLYGDGTAPPLGTLNSSIGSSGASYSGDVEISRGLFNLLTIYSQEPATIPGGTGRRININTQQTQLQQLVQQMTGRTINIRPGTRYLSIFSFYVQSGLTADQFSQIFDSLTTTTGVIQGRINVNTAPPEVLSCITGLGTNDVQAIISARAANAGNPAAGIGWFLKAIPGKAAALTNQITDQPSRYSADILAVSGNGRAFKRVRVVVDASGQTPQIIYRRDITDRGWPMDPNLLVTIRAGQFTGNQNGVQ
jgi:type II secretory pathway component PulK